MTIQDIEKLIVLRREDSAGILVAPDGLLPGE